MEPADRTLIQSSYQIIQAIDSCISQSLITPALILIYSAIDIYGSLERRAGEKTGESFRRWTHTYLLKHGPNECTPDDLFAARCGVLHEMSSQSDLFRKGKARRISYVFGGESKDNLKQALAALGETNHIVIDLNELYGALRHGIADYTEEIYSDSERLKVIEWGSRYTTLQGDSVSEFLKLEDDT